MTAAALSIIGRLREAGATLECKDGGRVRFSAAHDLDVPARYEVHLDRKLERTLAMLIRLRELRPATVPR